ncbi:MAG: class I SAM-dependent methyltransferase [Minisyncoccales bacterium]
MENCEYCYKYAKGFKRDNLDYFLTEDEYHGDIDLRWKKTNGIIDEIIEKYSNPRIADMSTGGGCDTIRLLKKGYNVVSNELNESYIPFVLDRAKIEGVNPEIKIEDWRNILHSDKYKDEEFDVILVLGNSFPTYLLTKEDREEALKGFWRILKPGGTLFFDTRNYDYILDNQEVILKDPENSFKYLGNTTYLKNDDYKIFPTLIRGELMHFCIKRLSNNQYDCMDCWAATENNTKEMIRNSLGDIGVEIYYDYKKEKPNHYDFVQYKLVKP